MLLIIWRLYNNMHTKYTTKQQINKMDGGLYINRKLQIYFKA